MTDSTWIVLICVSALALTLGFWQIDTFKKLTALKRRLDGINLRMLEHGPQIRIDESMSVAVDEPRESTISTAPWSGYVPDEGGIAIAVNASCDKCQQLIHSLSNESSIRDVVFLVERGGEVEEWIRGVRLEHHHLVWSSGWLLHRLGVRRFPSALQVRGSEVMRIEPIATVADLQRFTTLQSEERRR